MQNLQLLDLLSELFNLFKFVVFNEMNVLDALETTVIIDNWIICIKLSTKTPQQVKRDGTIFTSIE